MITKQPNYSALEYAQAIEFIRSFTQTTINEIFSFVEPAAVGKLRDRRKFSAIRGLAYLLWKCSGSFNLNRETHRTPIQRMLQTIEFSKMPVPGEYKYLSSLQISVMSRAASVAKVASERLTLDVDHQQCVTSYQAIFMFLVNLLSETTKTIGLELKSWEDSKFTYEGYVQILAQCCVVENLIESWSDKHIACLQHIEDGANEILEFADSLHVNDLNLVSGGKFNWPLQHAVRKAKSAANECIATGAY